MLKDKLLCVFCRSGEKAFDTVPRKVYECVTRMKGSVIGLCEEAKTRIRVDFRLSEEFEVMVGMDQGYVLSLYPFNVMIENGI